MTGTTLNSDDFWKAVELLHRYADAYDRRDADLLRSCYSNDAIFRSITPSGEERVFAGIDEIIANALNTFRAISATRRHQMTNARVRVEGKTAYMNSYLTLLEATKEGVSVILTGRYVDKLIRRSDGNWGIQSRVLHSDVEFAIPTVPPRQ